MSGRLAPPTEEPAGGETCEMRGGRSDLPEGWGDESGSPATIVQKVSTFTRQLVGAPFVQMLTERVVVLQKEKPPELRRCRGG